MDVDHDLGSRQMKELDQIIMASKSEMQQDWTKTDSITDNDISEPESRILNTSFINRIAWRMVNVVSRVCTWFLIWRLIGGAWLVSLILFEFFYYSIIAFLTKQFIFFEAFMGFILFKIIFVDDAVELLLNNHSCKWNDFLWVYQTLTGIIYLMGLTVLFCISSNSTHISTGLSFSMDIEEFAVIWYITVGLLLFCCILICTFQGLSIIIIAHTQQWISSIISLGRTIAYLMICIMFTYYIFALLIAIDAMIIILRQLYLFNSATGMLKGMVVDFVLLFSPSWMFAQAVSEVPDVHSYLLYGFQHFYSFMYFLLLIFFGLHGNDLNISYVVDYDSTTRILIKQGDFVSYTLISLLACWYIRRCVTVLDFSTNVY